MDSTVELTSFGTLREARLARDLLADAGIPCLLAEEHMGDAAWAYVNANRGVRLLVPQTRLEEARIALEELTAMLETEVNEYDLARQAMEDPPPDSEPA